jgi:hypothetical protein
MPSLFPAFDFSAFTSPPSADRAAGGDVSRYKPGPLFDFEKGDFVVDSRGRIVIGDGYQMWVQWCEKIMRTERMAHMAYSRSIGVEADEAFREPDRESVESAFERTITEALLADPSGRTRSVREFEFDWQPDALAISCVVVGAEGYSAQVGVSYARG